MFANRLFRLIHDRRLSVPVLRCFHHEFTKPELNSTQTKLNKSSPASPAVDAAHTATTTTTGAVQQKYKIFRDEDATEIFDVEEERERSSNNQTQNATTLNYMEDIYAGLNMQRGLHGVFDIEDLVDVLRKENAEDIFVCHVPEELKYVDHMVVCSGRSYRHMLAMAEFVRRMYKLKRNKNDILPKIEGAKSRDWMAMDLGNIALHIFSPIAREEYDLESLWAIGSQFDRESNKPDNPYGDLLLQSSTLFEEVKEK